MPITVANRHGPGPARFSITGEITDALAREITAELRALDGRALEVSIDSAGGSYPAGVKIYNGLRRHHGDVTTIVTGYAGSAASLIAMAGEQRLMCPGSRLMIHDVATPDASGPAHKVAEAAIALTSMANDLAAAYADRAGGSVEMWRDLMIKETTFTAAQAVEFGLATAIDWTRESVTASAGPVRIVYSPENRSGRGSSPFTGRESGWISMFDPALHPRTPLDLALYGLSPRRRGLDPMTAKWIGTCIAHALLNHPLARAILARAASN